MPTRYDIYLHSNQASSITSNTQPKEEPMNGAFSPVNEVVKNVQQFVTSGFNSYINTGVSALKKAVPAIAGVILAGKIADKVLTVGFGHLETYTGHYEYSMGWNNFKTEIGMALNPVGTMLKQLHIGKQNEINNRRQEQIRSLVGQVGKVGV